MALGQIMKAAKFIGPALPTAITVGMGYSQYRDYRARGEGFAPSTVKAVGQTILYNEFFLPMLALDMAPLMPIIHQKYENMMARKERAFMPMSPWGADPAAQTQYAQTSRARAIQAIQNSRLNARSYIGNEAGLFATRFR